ncbi:site-specific integrase [Prolixibacter denitrificans]|uniref:Site-specific recombinase XerD n=1 Tax=Prolixibacter denitrificans TaxID=1541063 RepID=A0A2P8CH31_9BACT|nr:site-specific integrase [Prolixibacter denitrificans]PSK84293.1 site-specific recombinase XerD [Prolixibacter denitrificans]GET20468.1 transposase [Prolixibacter denitrificans]
MSVITNLGKVRNDGTAPVYIVTYVNRDRVQFLTHVYCHPDKFDKVKGRVKGRGKRVNQQNLIIENCRSRLNKVFIDYELQNKKLTPKLLKNEYNNPALRIDFHKFLEEAIKERKDESAPRTIARDEVFQRRLKEFRKEIAFSEIDAEFIELFRRWLKKEHKNETNTLHKQLKIFRLYLNIAKRKGIIKENPFVSIRVKKQKTDRVFLEEDELQELWESYLEGKYIDSPAKHTVLRHFLFMCFTGMDHGGLRESVRFDNIFGNTLVFVREKTMTQKKETTKLPLTSKAIRLIDDEGKKDGNCFAAYTEPRMNKVLKQIAEDHKINKRVTTHVGRHTFATLFIQKTADVATLQKLLGHSSITTTMVYVHITDQQINKQMKQFDELIDF